MGDTPEPDHQSVRRFRPVAFTFAYCAAFVLGAMVFLYTGFVWSEAGLDSPTPCRDTVTVYIWIFLVAAPSAFLPCMALGNWATGPWYIAALPVLVPSLGFAPNFAMFAASCKFGWVLDLYQPSLSLAVGLILLSPALAVYVLYRGPRDPQI